MEGITIKILEAEKILKKHSVFTDELSSEIVSNLISTVKGRNVRLLRKETLDFIKQNQVPNSLAIMIKQKIEAYIEELIIRI